MQADDGVVLDQRVVHRGGRDPARGEADDHQPALEGDALGGAVVDVTAHRVVDDVGARAAGEVLDRLDEVALLVVEGEVGAQLPAEGDLGVGAGGRHHPRAGRLAQLDRGAANAAGAGVDEDTPSLSCAAVEPK